MSPDFRKLNPGDVVKVFINDVLGLHHCIAGVSEIREEYLLLENVDNGCICGGILINKNEITRIIRINFEEENFEEI